MKKILLTLLFSLLIGCEIVGPEFEGVVGSVKTSSIVLTNGQGAPVYYFTLGRQDDIAVDWHPGIGKDNEIQHGKSKEIPLEDIFLSETAEEVIVYWWEAQKDGGEVRAGEIYHFVLKL